MADIVRPRDQDAAVSVLEQFLPTAVHLQGPAGVGKTASVQWLAKYHGISELDCLIMDSGAPGMRDVRRAEAFLRDYGVSGKRLVSFDLEGSSEAVQNALLKIVEEPPPSAVMILRSTSSLLPTLESRCLRFAFGSLSVDTLVSVLLDEGFSEDACVSVAQASGGSLARARELISAYDVRLRVASIVTMMSTGADDIVFDAVPQNMKDVQDVCSVLADVAMWYAVGRVHPMMEDASVSAPSRASAAVLARALMEGRPSRALIRSALWQARTVR